MRVLITLVLCVLIYCVHAQKTSPFIKFGKVSPADLERKIYSVDSQANAVVLSDIGKAGIEGNSRGWFSLVSTHHRVVHILNKNGYDEADVNIRLYGSEGNSEKLESLKAVTYNLVNGKLVETKLEKGSIFTEKIDRNWSLRKFTMPNVKEGSIIEFEYKIVSDYIRHLEPWYFQGSAPRLWSEFVFSAPAFFTYSFIRNGYHPLYLEDRKDRAGNFAVTIKKDVGLSDVEENIVISSGISDYRWIMIDVPELKPERFTSTLKNHISKIEFQLVSQSEPLAPHSFVLSWKDLTRELLNSEHFGSMLNQFDNWTNSDLKQVGLRVGSEREQAIKCFNYIRDTYSWTEKRGVYLDRSMREVVKTKKGSVPEINLLLTGLLKYAGLDAEPVILSTTDHGYVYENYPSLASFNYVICRLVADGKTYYLDASNPHLGFGKLDPSLHNGNAIAVNEEATVIKLSADSLTENKKTLLLVSADETGKWMGRVTQTLGDYESYLVR